jgi:ribosomal protein S18 acetylase RimI-like enzyme
LTPYAPTLVLRRYTDADRRRVWHLHEEGLRQTDSYIGAGPWDDDLRSIPGTYLDGTGEFLVGTLHDQVVAMGALRRVSDTVCELKRMRVDPRHQRQGFGRAILTKLEDRAKQLGYTTIRLDTTTNQTAARHLYRAGGYQEAERSTDPAGQITILFQKTI